MNSVKTSLPKISPLPSIQLEKAVFRGWRRTRMFISALVIALAAAVLPSKAGDVVGHVFCGYQGWFNTLSDGTTIGWRHWAIGTPAPGNVTVEMWPDVRGHYAPLYTSGLAPLGDGSPAKLFSSRHQTTVDTHFYWMQINEIDGAALQRFGVELYNTTTLSNLNAVLTNVVTSAQTYGRKFYITYDVSGMGSYADWVTKIQNDWLSSTVTLAVASGVYAKEGTKPVVELWGIGLNGNNTPTSSVECLTLINWFKSQNCYVVGGLPTYWRTSTGDSRTGFTAVYDACNMISPWATGRFSTDAGADSYMSGTMVPDFSYCNARGIAYQPCFFPGFSWSNWNGGPRNEIARRQGKFMWRQVYNIRRSGINTAYLAMFDEYDEASAITKAASDSSMIPTNQYFLTLSADGQFVSPDFYLRLARSATRVIKGIDANTAIVPIALSASPDWFRTGLEYDTAAATPYTYDPYTSWTNTVDWKVNVGPHVAGDVIPMCLKVLDQYAHRGRGSILCKGNDESAATSYCYFKVFDVNIPVNSNTKLSYWTYPQGDLGRFVAVDFVMTDGTSLRDSGAVDQNGVSVHPAQGRGTSGVWSQTVCNVGQWLNGKTIDRIQIAYDHGADTGQFVAWLDDIEITDAFPSGNYKIVNLESGKALYAASTANNAGLGVWSYPGGTNQQWRIENFEAGRSLLYCTSAADKVAYMNSTNNNALARIYTYAPGVSSRWWDMVPYGCRYRLKNVWTGMFLKEYATTNGALVKQTSSAVANSQLWSIQTP